MVTSLVITLIAAAGRNLWLGLLQTPKEAFTDATVYLLICAIGVPFVYETGTICAILRGVGDSKRPMYILGVSAVINVVLDFWFIAGLGWGAAGAAWATSISQVAAGIYAFYVFLRTCRGLGFEMKAENFRLHGRSLKAILKLGLPLVVQSVCVTLSMLVVTAMVNTYGVAASAVTGIGQKLNSLINVVTGGIQTSVASVIAQNFAARKIDRVRKVYRTGNEICFIFFLFLAFVSWFFPARIIGFFTQPSETEVLAYAPTYMHIAIILYFAFCTMTTSLGHINAVGFTFLNLIIAMIDAVVGRLGISFLLGNVLGLGVYGYWLGNALSALISVVMGVGYYIFGNWENRKILA